MMGAEADDLQFMRTVNELILIKMMYFLNI